MTNRISVLIIEDEQHISDFIRNILRSQNYKAIQAFSGKEAISLISSQCPDVILLDLGLPDMNGLSIISEVRTWSSSPIIVVSARSNEKEKVRALDLGADDYITKPFGTSELLARIRTSLRHGNRKTGDSTSSEHLYISDGLTIDFSRRTVFLEGTEVHLTPVEYKIVSLLAKNSGKVITHSTIMTNIWGPVCGPDTYTDKNKILRVNMVNIRRKLEKNPADPKYIFTEVGVGYRLREEK